MGTDGSNNGDPIPCHLKMWLDIQIRMFRCSRSTLSITKQQDETSELLHRLVWNGAECSLQIKNRTVQVERKATVGDQAYSID